MLYNSKITSNHFIKDNVDVKEFLSLNFMLMILIEYPSHHFKIKKEKK